MSSPSPGSCEKGFSLLVSFLDSKLIYSYKIKAKLFSKGNWRIAAVHYIYLFQKSSNKIMFLLKRSKVSADIKVKLLNSINN